MRPQPQRVVRASPLHRSRIRRAVWILGFGMVLTLFFFLLVVQHIPGHYRPATLDDEGLRQARLELAALVEEVSGQMVLGAPFRLEITQESVNRLLALAMHDRVEIRNHMPEGVSIPAIGLEAGGLVVGGQVDRGGWRVIVSISMELSAAVGHDVAFRMSGCALGSLPVPAAVWRRNLSSVRMGNAVGPTWGLRANSAGGIGVGDEESPVFSVTNDFVWPNGERRFRIADLAFRAGALLVKIEPLASRTR